MIAVEENDDLGLEYMDSHLSNVLNTGRSPSVNDYNNSKQLGTVDAQKAFKNRVLHFHKLKTGASMYEHNIASESPSNDNFKWESPMSQKQTSKKAFEKANASTTEGTGGAMVQVNKLNHTLYNRIQYNASAIGKRFTHKSAPKFSRIPQ